MTEMIQFDLPKGQSSIIKVIGVGGGGSNAVNHMYKQGIEGVDFIVCNTDEQALNISPVPTKVQIGASLTEGRGAGSIPAVGKNAAIENIDQIKALLETNTKMLFITAGMGGGTGTGAAPVIAATAKELGILTVAIVTIPFSFEGNKRRLQANEGIKELRKNVDTLLIICNDKLREFGDLGISKAFSKADNILTTAAKGIAEIITIPGYINVDFEDVKTVMKNSGVAIMGSGYAEGENRAQKAVEMALSSPLLNDNHIKGASNILLYIASGKAEITMDEITEITEHIQNESGATAEIIWGNGNDESLGDQIGVTLIATGFNSMENIGGITEVKPKAKTISLDEPVKTPENTIKKEENEIDIIDGIHIKEISEYTNPPEEKNTIKFERTVHSLFDNDDEITMKKEDSNIEEVQNIANEPVFMVRPAEEKTEIVKNKTEIEVTEDNPEVNQTHRERIERLKAISMKIKTKNGVTELEKEPAYLRKNVTLSNVTPSSESHVSRLTLSENDDNKGELKSNNAYLHDNVD